MRSSLRRASVGIGGDTERDAEPGVDPLLLEEDVPLDDAAELLGENPRRRAVGLGADDRELVAAVAGRVVGLADGGADEEAHLAQRPAAAQVAVEVVDGLEAVEVDEDEGERSPRNVLRA